MHDNLDPDLEPTIVQLLAQEVTDSLKYLLAHNYIGNYSNLRISPGADCYTFSVAIQPICPITYISISLPEDTISHQDLQAIVDEYNEQYN